MSAAMSAKHILTEPEALKWLEHKASEIPQDRAIVEIGVYQGGSLIHLARGANGEVWGIDPWGLEGAYYGRSSMLRKYSKSNMTITKANLEKENLSHKVSLVRNFSVVAAREWEGPKIGLLYIDALHTEQAVLSDYEAWIIHMAPHGWIAYDDYCDRFPGVMDAVDRLHGNRFTVVGSRLAIVQI